jgi:hypothetical protein
MAARLSVAGLMTIVRVVALDCAVLMASASGAARWTRPFFSSSESWP